MNKKQDRNSFSSPRTLRSMFSTLESDDELGDLILDRTEGWYEAKHSSFSCPEIEFVNSIKVTCCPYCGSDRFRKIGHRKDGTQCFRCNSCKRKFNPLTGSIFDSRKIPVGEWIEFLIHLFQYQSIKVASIDNRNAYSTGRYWLNKIFEVLKNYQAGIVMGDRFWTDETYLKLMPKDLKRDGKGRLLRGLSRNNLCIMTLTDGTRTVLIADGTGKPSRKLEPHIKQGSHMIDDGEKSHVVLAEELNLTREIHKTAETKGLPDKENPMGLINTVHRFFKRFMKAHGGYSRDELQDWCNSQSDKISGTDVKKALIHRVLLTSCANQYFSVKTVIGLKKCMGIFLLLFAHMKKRKASVDAFP